MQPATEKRLMACIDQTGQHVAAGMRPNEAVVKAAKAVQLRPSEIDMVVRAYNTGATNKQRLNHDDPWEKSADFELADADVVRDLLYPSNEKTASANSPLSDEIAPEYAISPATMLERLAKREKMAHVINWREINGQAVTAPAPYPEDPAAAGVREAAAQQRAQQQFYDARREKSAAMDQLRIAFSQLGEHFQQLDSSPLAAVKTAAAVVYGEQIAGPVFEKLAIHYPELTKLPQHRDTRQRSVSPQDPVFMKLAAVIGASESYREKCAAFESVEAAQQDRSHLVRPMQTIETIHSSVLDDVPEKRAFNPLSALGTYGLANRVVTDTHKALEPTDQKGLIQQNLDILEDPEHEAKLHEIDAEANLHDMLANDSMVSGYSPDDVATAFNELSQAAPSAASHRPIMQSILRKRLAQGDVDAFDMNQLLDLETKLRKTHSDPGFQGLSHDPTK